LPQSSLGSDDREFRHDERDTVIEGLAMSFEIGVDVAYAE